MCKFLIYLKVYIVFRMFIREKKRKKEKKMYIEFTYMAMSLNVSVLFNFSSNIMECVLNYSLCNLVNFPTYIFSGMASL